MLVSSGIAFGHAATSNPTWEGYTSYSSLSSEFASANHPSPRYWLLWPGIACMIAVSFTGMEFSNLFLGAWLTVYQSLLANGESLYCPVKYCTEACHEFGHE